MRTLLPFILFFLVVSLQVDATYAQNLVPNPGFETPASCPSNNVFTAATWSSPGSGSPDYFNPCGSGWTVPGPSVLFGPQTANSGNSFAGIGWYGLGGGWYEYVQIQLSSPLLAGETYLVSMHVSLADGVRKASDDMGIYISNAAIGQPGFGPITTVTPQLKFTDGVFVTQTTGWQQISGNYLATGGEEFITIGCFEPWTTTGTLDVNPPGNDRCYYYVDDVSVERIVGLPVELVSFTTSRTDTRNVEVQWKTASENNSCFFELERSTDGEYYQNIHTAEAAGNSSSEIIYQFVDKGCPPGVVYYRLKQVDCDGQYSYSNVRTVQKESAFDEVHIYPNPVVDILKISFNHPVKNPVELSLYDVSGKMCHFQKVEAVDQTEISSSIQSLPQGVYTLTIIGESIEPVVRKIIKSQ